MKKFLFFFVVSFPMLIPLKSIASHAAGLELRYEHLTGNDFRFHFILYRDCIGIPVAPQYTIAGTSTCGGSVSFFVVNDSTVDVSQMCADSVSQCVNNASPFMGIEANYYHGDVTLPSQCNIWTFGLAFEICNRNLGITNLVNPASLCSYVETTLNNSDAADNSSPVFTALPLFHLCTQVQTLHLYAQDPDGDSLAFEMYTPHSDADTDVVYINGLSATQPVTFAMPADSTWFDPATGEIRLKADVAQITVIGVRVNEFRNGIFIGSQERDIEVVFSNCASHAPTATGINGAFSFSTHVCVDSLFTFHINTVDVDGDSVRVFWQNNAPGGTVNLSGINNGIVNFNWQPTSSDINSDPYLFTLYVTDSTCPYVYYNSYQYKIYVDSCFATGINETDHSFSFNASYSASDQSIVFSYESAEANEQTFFLHDLQGRILWRDEMKSITKFSGKIPASSLSPGLYFLEMKTLNGESRTIKVMKN